MWCENLEHEQIFPCVPSLPNSSVSPSVTALHKPTTHSSALLLPPCVFGETDPQQHPHIQSCIVCLRSRYSRVNRGGASVLPHCQATLFTTHLPLRLTINSNLAGTSESRLMLIRSRPASFSLGRSLAKFMPLVVMAMVLRSSNFLSSAIEGEMWKEENQSRREIETKEEE